MSSTSGSLVLGVDMRPTDVVGAVLALAAPDFVQLVMINYCFLQ